MGGGGVSPRALGGVGVLHPLRRLVARPYHQPHPAWCPGAPFLSRDPCPPHRHRPEYPPSRLWRGCPPTGVRPFFPGRERERMRERRWERGWEYWREWGREYGREYGREWMRGAVLDPPGWMGRRRRHPRCRLCPRRPPRTPPRPPAIPVGRGEPRTVTSEVHRQPPYLRRTMQDRVSGAGVSQPPRPR